MLLGSSQVCPENPAVQRQSAFPAAPTAQVAPFKQGLLSQGSHKYNIKMLNAFVEGTDVDGFACGSRKSAWADAYYVPVANSAAPAV